MVKRPPYSPQRSFESQECTTGADANMGQDEAKP